MPYDVEANRLATRDSAPLSLDAKMLEAILTHAKPMGHREQKSRLNLGFGFVYYGLVRALRPRHVLVIGSGYGFSVVCFALGLKDNGRGKLSFVDPSYSLLRDGPQHTVGGANFWHDPEHVHSHFARFGVEEIVTHYKETSESFFAHYAALGLPEIDLALVDGNHAPTHVQRDVIGVLQNCHRNTYFLLHDTNIYIRELLRHAGVKRWLRKQAGQNKSAFEYVDFPFSSGVALVRVLEPSVWKTLS